MRRMSEQNPPKPGPPRTANPTSDTDQPRDAHHPRDTETSDTDRPSDDRPGDTEPRDADELADAVTGLGSNDDERLDTVAERNASLEERLPGDDDLPLTKG